METCESSAHKEIFAIPNDALKQAIDSHSPPSKLLSTLENSGYSVDIVPSDTSPNGHATYISTTQEIIKHENSVRKPCHSEPDSQLPIARLCFLPNLSTTAGSEKSNYETAEEEFSKSEEPNEASYKKMISVTEGDINTSTEDDRSSILVPSINTSTEDDRSSILVPSFSDSYETGEESVEGPPLIFVSSPGSALSKGVTTPMTSMSRDTSESMVVDSDGEDYFEEFHLPNTHENAFVRHLSFRKKVQTTPINAPDAERIEGLVRTGEFVRHGSIRKKILPEENEEEYEEEDEDFAFDESSSFSDGIEREIREAGKCFSEENLDISYSRERGESLSNGAPKLKRCYSTPINTIAETASIFANDKESSKSIQDMSFNEFKDKVSIDEVTLKKIQGCLDYSSYRDLLNLSGRLTDMLSPKEVEEVLSHAERYRQFIDSEVLEALSISYQSNMQALPDGEAESEKPHIPNTDSGFSSPKTIKDDDKDLPIKEQFDEYSDQEQSSIYTPYLKGQFMGQPFGEGFEKRSSENLTDVHRMSVPFGGLAAIGIFEESLSQADVGKRKICAPTGLLDYSSDGRAAESDEDGHVPDEDDYAVNTYKRMISVTEGVFDTSVDDDEYYNIVRTERSKSITDSMRNFTNLESGSMHNTSTLSLSIEEERLPPSDPFSQIHQTSYDDACPPHPPDLIPELTAAEELNEERHWRNVVIGGAWRRIDMKVIAPYKRCISHGGYLEVNKNPVVLISSVYLPNKSRRDYHYVMDNLFMYVLSFVEQLAADDYVLVYLAGGSQNNGPGFHWMKRAYEMIDRRLRKSLKSLLVVHPSLWARTIVTLSRPFISSKFYRKLQFVRNLTELAQIVSLDQLDIPDSVKQADFEMMIKEKKKLQSKH